MENAKLEADMDTSAPAALTDSDEDSEHDATVDAGSGDDSDAGVEEASWCQEVLFGRRGQ